jgi:diguanylate cyclase (GGDEF)-like protein
VLRGTENFVLSTPDLDAPGFLRELRSVCIRIRPGAGAVELEAHRQWAAETLAGFGQEQRRYLSEREDELWRILRLYQDHQKHDSVSNQVFRDSLRGVHERLGNVVRLTDLRLARERLEAELQRAQRLVQEKSWADRARADELSARVREVQAALISARKEGLRDPLTGVLNHGAFRTILETALSSPLPCSLAIVDVDDLAEINEEWGLETGDQVLRMVAEQMGRLARPGDVIGRLGNDEFALLAVGHAPDRLAERFDGAPTPRPAVIDDSGEMRSVPFTFTVGVTGSLPEDSVEGFLGRAEHALCEAKESGNGSLKVLT